jgi:hypothetical protein
MTLRLRPHTGSTRLDIVLDEFAESGPSIITTDQVYSLSLAGVSGKYVVMLIAEDAESEVIAVRNIY